MRDLKPLKSVGDRMEERLDQVLVHLRVVVVVPWGRGLRR